MTIGAPSVTAQRAWGITASVVAVLSLVPSLLVLLMVWTVSVTSGMLLWLTLPLGIIGGGLAAVLGVVGLIIAIVRRAGYIWPIAGTVLGLVVAVGIFEWARY